MRDGIQRLLTAARVPDTVQPQMFGLWRIRRLHLTQGDALRVGWPTQTRLERYTLAVEMAEHGEGALVMEDSQRELSRHLPCWLHAHGNVLVTGLGLGCVVRGLLACPKVEHIDVVEIDRGILHVIGAEFVRHPKVTLHHGDALTWAPGPRQRWTLGWHDLWSAPEEGHLAILHGKVLLRFAPYCDAQGAWQFPRAFKRLWPTPLIG